MTFRSNPDNRARSKPATKRPAPSPAPPKVRAEVTLAVLQEAHRVDPKRAEHTSLSLATAVEVDRNQYSKSEQEAATAVHAMDYGLSAGRNARDALSFVEATSWPGFPTLGLLAQLPEYRTMHETPADECVRTWGKVTSTSEDDAAADKVKRLTQKLEQYGVRRLIRTAVVHDQAYGGAHIFPHLKMDGSTVPADAPLLLEPSFVKPGCLTGFTAIEPMWLTPNAYNATDPTLPNFYKPDSWIASSGRKIHCSRVFTIIGRPVGDILKAAYSFRGVSISQLAMPYVDNWLRTRQSVSDTVKQFSITNLATDLAQLLAPGGAQSLDMRVQLFNLNRDNRNVGVVDKETEEIQQVNTPLSGLDALQAQSQEQMSAVSHIPLVKLLGITPAGLNANSDGEIRVWYDFVAGYQAHNLSPLMEWILDLIQLSEYGQIDPGLSWDWNPLYELDDKELAEVRYKNAETDRVLTEIGAIDAPMVQQRLAGDPTSGYAGPLGDRDELDDVEDIAQQMMTEALAPQPQQEPTNDPDADQPDPEAAPAGGNQPGSDG